MIIYEAVRAQGTPFANVLSLLFVVVLVTVLILFAILSRNSNRRDE
jgi:ABC-type spermidine/putrescine transport system permease subunit II